MDNPTEHVAPPQPRPPRRRPWVLPAAFGGVLLVGMLTAAVLTTGQDTDGDWTSSGTGDTVDVSEASLDALFEPAAADALPEAFAEGRERPFRGEHRRGHPLRLRDGEKVLAGAVSSVGDGSLVVRKDNGAEVTVPTDDDTKVRGAQNKNLTDLGSGERVLVRVGSDGTAVRVLAVRAHAAGTVTALDGDRATVVRPGGLAVTLDLSGVTERPAVGMTVVAVGTATDDGATLKVEQLKELPTLG